jgi:hypothetical protein
MNADNNVPNEPSPEHADHHYNQLIKHGREIENHPNPRRREAPRAPAGEDKAEGIAVARASEARCSLAAALERQDSREQFEFQVRAPRLLHLCIQDIPLGRPDANNPTVKSSLLVDTWAS